MHPYDDGLALLYTNGNLLSISPVPFNVNIMPTWTNSWADLRHPVCNTTVWNGRVDAVTGVVVLCQLGCIGGCLQESTQLTPSVQPISTLRKAHTERQRPLIQDEVHISRLPALKIDSVCTERPRGLDDLHVEACAKWLEMRDCEVVRTGVGRVREEGGELGEAKGGEDAHDVRVVREVKVEGLVEGERGGVVVEGRVDL